MWRDQRFWIPPLLSENFKWKLTNFISPSIEREQPRSQERATRLGSEFEVYLQGIDERKEPGEQLLVDGMSVVGVEGGAVGELHDTAELIALAAR
jgi:hypothetical protein